MQLSTVKKMGQEILINTNMKKLIYNSEQGRVTKIRKRIRRIGEMPKELLEEFKKLTLAEKLRYEAGT